MRFCPANRSRTAMTRVELLALLVMGGIFVGFALPQVDKVREAGARTTSLNNLKQLALAIHNINDVYRKLPPAVGAFPQQNDVQPTLARGSFFYYALPFVEEDVLFKRGIVGGNTFVWANDVMAAEVKLFTCPADRTNPGRRPYKGWLATGSYAANYLVFGTGFGSASIPRTFQDGTSNTVVFAERYQMCNGQPNGWGYFGISPWAPMFAYYSVEKFQVMPEDRNCNPYVPQAFFRGGVNISLADGSSRIVSPSVSLQTWGAILTPAGGEVIQDDF